MDPPRVYHGSPGVAHPSVSLSEFTLRHLRHFAALGERSPPAQVDAVTGHSMSYGVLLERSVCAARSWGALGLGVGDTVAVCSNNHLALCPTVLGAMFNGCTVAAIVPSSNTEELLDSLLLVSPRAVISDELTAPTMAAASRALADALGAGPAKHVVLVAEGCGDRLAEVLALDSVMPGGVMSSEDLFVVGARQDIDSYAPAAIADAKQHVAYVLFSSGTTGKPKAVMTSDHSILIHTLNPGAWTILEGERFLVLAAFSCIAGVLTMFHCAIVGATRVFLNGCTDAHTWLGTVHKYKINLALSPPWLLSLVPGVMSATAGPDRQPPYDVSSLRAVATGGAALGADMQAAVQAALGCPVGQRYGCTEAGPVLSDSTGLPGQSPPRPGSLGRLHPWPVHLRLVDPISGRDVPGEEGEGELRFKTPYLMLGYVGDPKASAQAFDEHGFYCSGDLARRDSDGYFYFVDRIKELMKYNNKPIAASEVEEVLLFHSAVSEVCVLGRPHPIHGDLPTAFVVRSAGVHRDEELLRQDFNQLLRIRLADHKRLRGGIYFVDEIPKTSSGKKDRNKLKKRLASAEVFAKLDTY